MGNITSQKVCSKCKNLKDINEFGTNRAQKDGKSIYCFHCRNEQASQWRKTPRGKVRQERLYCVSATLKYEYGIDLTRYNEILASQNGTCAICNSPPTFRRLDVDHCHITGKVRGLLCKRCNTGLGCFHDKEELLKAATNYLETAEDLRCPNR